MRKLIYLVLLLVLGGLGFAAGRFTAAPPEFQPGSASAEDPLAAAFEDFQRAQRETIALLRASPFYGDEQERAEAYRGLLYSLIGSIKVGALQSSDHPRFMRAVDWTSKSGLDNPDNNYYMAQISDAAEYRITGNRGSTRNMIFQLVVGQPGVRGAGSSTNVSVLRDRDMHIDAEGNFEVIVSRENPGPDVNWLPNGDGAQTLIMRHTHSDWTREEHTAPYIVKLGAEGTAAPLLSEEQMAYGLREAAVSLFDRTATWLNYASMGWNLRPRNGMAPAALTRGGLVGQYSAFGSWELDEDQALVLRTARTEADYQGIELGNLWFVSLDYENRTTTLNLDQLYCGEDDYCYAVISHRDPGVQNWLDTEGHRRGLIMMRWQGLIGEFPEEKQPEAQLVDFYKLHEALPPDTPRFTAEQRAEQISQRRRDVHRRFGG